MIIFIRIIKDNKNFNPNQEKSKYNLTNHDIKYFLKYYRLLKSIYVNRYYIIKSKKHPFIFYIHH